LEFGQSIGDVERSQWDDEGAQARKPQEAFRLGFILSVQAALARQTTKLALNRCCLASAHDSAS
jgi:hypothetical protein